MTVIQQRPLRGSRISSFYPVKKLPSLASLDSAFQLQEYISLLIRLDVHDVEAIVSLPGKGSGKEKEKEKDDEISTDSSEDNAQDKDGGDKDRKTEVAVDEACWIYEQLRRLAQDLSHPLITMLQQECTRASCPEMKAGEWLYLCVAHGNDGAMEQCCAIDYILHTVDSATALLNSPRTFPSRLQIPQTSHRHFSALARRLGRIFAHAYFHHREAFEQAEVESSLYARFLALTSKFDLVPSEFLVIPQRLSHEDDDDMSRDVQPPRLLAAAVDPQGQSERSQSVSHSDSAPHWDRRGSVVGPTDRAKSHSPPGLASGSESPRKFGRNRTDTMVFSEASTVAEDLAKFEEEPVAARAVDIPIANSGGTEEKHDLTDETKPVESTAVVKPDSSTAVPLPLNDNPDTSILPPSPPKTARPLQPEGQPSNIEAAPASEPEDTPAQPSTPAEPQADLETEERDTNDDEPNTEPITAPESAILLEQTELTKDETSEVPVVSVVEPSPTSDSFSQAAETAASAIEEPTRELDIGDIEGGAPLEAEALVSSVTSAESPDVPVIESMPTPEIPTPDIASDEGIPNAADSEKESEGKAESISDAPVPPAEDEPVVPTPVTESEEGLAADALLDYPIADDLVSLVAEEPAASTMSVDELDQVAQPDSVMEADITTEAPMPPP